jgi:general secretion pathway protein K
MTHRDRTSGVALINALLLIAAMSSVAVMLLHRAEQSHSLVRHQQDLAQAKAYLDGMESQVRLILDADMNLGDFDHLAEDWAKDNFQIDAEYGRVSAKVDDLSGRFNLHWLGAEVPYAKPVLNQIITHIGLPASLVDGITDWVSEGGPDAILNNARRQPEILVTGGVPTVLETLLEIPAMDFDRLRRLDAFVTSIEAEPVVNINTASRHVLIGMFAGLSNGIIDKLVADRIDSPFENGDEIGIWFANNLDPATLEVTDFSALVVSSDWFQARIVATVNKTRLTRRVIYQRSRDSAKTLVVLRYIAKLDQVDKR